MAGPRLYSEEEVTHQAYDIFLELAPDNLSEQDIARLSYQVLTLKRYHTPDV